jgi:multidrug efflux pump subunit AcrA (membrane-fusion protein)
MNRKIFLAVTVMSVAAAIAVFNSCSRGNKAAIQAAAAETETVYAVNTAIAHTGNLDDYIEFGGNVTASSSIDVMPEVAGKVYRLLVNNGAYVQKNELLMEIDPSRVGMNYQLSPVRSPITGTVTSLPYNIGATVSPTMPVARIAAGNGENMQVHVRVAERFISRIKMGEQAKLSFDAYPGKTYKAEVVEISPTLDQTSRTMLVKLAVLENPDHEVKIGMFARVQLITDALKDVVVLPAADAVVSGDGKSFVFVVDTESNTVRQVEIKPGITVDNMMEVESGLKDGDEVVVKGQTLLESGSKVKVLRNEGGAE